MGKYVISMGPGKLRTAVLVYLCEKVVIVFGDIVVEVRGGWVLVCCGL